MTHAFEFDVSNPSLKRSESSIDMTMRDVSDGSAASATTVVGVGEPAGPILEARRARWICVNSGEGKWKRCPYRTSVVKSAPSSESDRRRERNREVTWGATSSERRSTPRACRIGDEGRLFRDFIILRELGRGLCGTVYLAKYRLTDQLVAFKVMRKQKLIGVGEMRHGEVLGGRACRHQRWTVHRQAFARVSGSMGVVLGVGIRAVR